MLTPAANNELVRIADHLQSDYTEGPAVDTGARTVTCADLATSSRWPRWAPRVAALGASSLTCLPLHAGRQSLGALTMYRQQPHPYSHHDLQVAELIGSHVAVVPEHLDMCDHAWAAVDARHRIGKAQGVPSTSLTSPTSRHSRCCAAPPKTPTARSAISPPTLSPPESYPPPTASA